MDPFSMVVGIVLITAVASVIRSHHKAKYGIIENKDGSNVRLSDPDAERLREEVRTLKDRVAVLERIATDKTNRLESEIEALRDDR